MKISSDNIPFERDCHSSITKNNLVYLAEREGFLVRWQTNHTARISHVELLVGNSVVASGSGKGSEYEVGALAEAFEHMVAFSSNGDKICPSHSVANNKYFKKDGLLLSLAFTEDVGIVCDLLDVDNQRVPIPVSLRISSVSDQKDNQATKFLKRYQTNSGIAFGSTLNESILHGSLELIERHYLSNFFSKIIGFSDNKFFNAGKLKQYAKLFNINADNLPNANVVIANYFHNIWFAMVIENDRTHAISSIGSSASISMYHALYRALNEYNQVCLLYDDNCKKTDEQCCEFLKTSAKLALLVYCQTNNFQSINLKLIDDRHSFSTFDMLKKLAVFKIMTKCLRIFQGVGVVTRVYIPGLDRFNLIRSGNLVAPQSILLKSC